MFSGSRFFQMMHENFVQADLVAHNQVLRILFWKFWWSEPIYPNLVWRNLDRSRSQLSNDTKIIKFGQNLIHKIKILIIIANFVDSRFSDPSPSPQRTSRPRFCGSRISSKMTKVLPRIWGLWICWLIARRRPSGRITRSDFLTKSASTTSSQIIFRTPLWSILIPRWGIPAARKIFWTLWNQKVSRSETKT